MQLTDTGLEKLVTLNLDSVQGLVKTNIINLGPQDTKKRLCQVEVAPLVVQSQRAFDLSHRRALNAVACMGPQHIYILVQTYITACLSFLYSSITIE